MSEGKPHPHVTALHAAEVYVVQCAEAFITRGTSLNLEALHAAVQRLQEARHAVVPTRRMIQANLERARYEAAAAWRTLQQEQPK